MSFLDIIRKRRTQYALGNQIELSQEAVNDLVRQVVKESPSAFNSQSSRVVVLFGEEHKKLWNIVRETLKAIVPAESFGPTNEKMDSFTKGAGTILFFEDKKVIESLQEQFPLYADKFPEFSAHAAGMAQFAVWTALAHANIGASLQHYNPLIDEAVRQAWGLPESWYLSAQMPFGSNEQAFGDKEYMDDEARFRFFAS